MLTERQGPCLWRDGPLTGNPSPGVEGVTSVWWRMMGKINGEQHTERPLMSSVQGERVQSHLTSDLNPAHVFVCIHACILKVKPPSVLNSLILCFIYFKEWWQKCSSATLPVKLPKLLPPLPAIKRCLIETSNKLLCHDLSQLSLISET